MPPPNSLVRQRRIYSKWMMPKLTSSLVVESRVWLQISILMLQSNMKNNNWNNRENRSCKPIRMSICNWTIELVKNKLLRESELNSTVLKCSVRSTWNMYQVNRNATFSCRNILISSNPFLRYQEKYLPLTPISSISMREILIQNCRMSLNRISHKRLNPSLKD